MSLSDLPGHVPDPSVVAASPGGGSTAALAEPERRVRPLWTTGVVLVNVGINAAFFGPIQVLLGQQAAHFSEGDKEAILALVTGAGASRVLLLTVSGLVQSVRCRRLSLFEAEEDLKKACSLLTRC